MVEGAAQAEPKFENQSGPARNLLHGPGDAGILRLEPKQGFFQSGQHVFRRSFLERFDMKVVARVGSGAEASRSQMVVIAPAEQLGLTCSRAGARTSMGRPGQRDVLDG
jgi:hypothetical protein